MQTRDVIETIALLLAAGLVCQLAADLVRLPRMLLLLGAGALLGPSVADLFDLPLTGTGSEVVFTLGVSFILFHGGLQLSTRVLGRVAVSLWLLAVPGVVVGAFVTGIVAAAAFGLPFSSGLLIGAVLAPTDPAILIPLFERLRVRPKLVQTVVAESALNDPTGAVLALVVASVVLSGNASVTKAAEDFVRDLALSTGLGVVFGVVLSLVVSSHRAGVWRESAAVVVLAVVAGGYVTLDSAGGSGYLGSFLAGLIVGNMDRLGLAMHSHHEGEMRVLVSNVADVMVMFVFLILGASLPWGDMAAHLGPALAVVAALVLVSRPLVVLSCLLPDRRARWSREELLFVAWTRETGVVPAALAGVMVGLKVPDAKLIVTTVAVAILVTLGIQSTTKRRLARRLGLLQPD